MYRCSKTSGSAGGGKYAGEIFRYNMPEGAKAEAKKIFDAARRAGCLDRAHIAPPTKRKSKKVFEFAKYFGAEAMTVEAPESALPAYDRFAKEYGIKAGLYNHRAKPKGGKAEPPYSTPEKMNAALARRSGLGAFPDCGHWGRSGFDIIESLKKLEGKISAVNIQDLTESGGCEEYGKGVLPLDDFLKELEKLGFGRLVRRDVRRRPRPFADRKSRPVGKVPRSARLSKIGKKVLAKGANRGRMSGIFNSNDGFFRT